MDQVEIEDIRENLSSIGIAGAHSGEALKAAGFQFPQLQALQITTISWKQINVTLMRYDNPLVESYELWSAPGGTKTLREALANAGATLVGEAAVELLRIAAGIPRYGQDIRERDLPQETEQSRALSFTKGCYIGQEIVERIRSRGAVHRTFLGFEIAGPLPTPEQRSRWTAKISAKLPASHPCPPTATSARSPSDTAAVRSQLREGKW